jgi:hypothetical protein
MITFLIVLAVLAYLIGGRVIIGSLHEIDAIDIPGNDEMCAFMLTTVFPIICIWILIRSISNVIIRKILKF